MSQRLAMTVTLFLLGLSSTAAAQEWDIPFTKHVLDNGLEVVLYEDHSDPVVAVYVVYHVGSSREELGRSGFAHLFEHLMFQGSQHVGDDQHFKLISEAGGTLNGTTNRDRTNYFEVLPSNQLELALWLEADRMGFLLPAITVENLDNQREVVKNERRQNYENRPYAQAGVRIAAALYPSEHPYSWLTIGTTAQGHCYLLNNGTTVTRNVKYYIFKKLTTTSNFGRALDINQPQIRIAVVSRF